MTLQTSSSRSAQGVEAIRFTNSIGTGGGPRLRVQRFLSTPGTFNRSAHRPGNGRFVGEGPPCAWRRSDAGSARSLPLRCGARSDRIQTSFPPPGSRSGAILFIPSQPGVWSQQHPLRYHPRQLEYEVRAGTWSSRKGGSPQCSTRSKGTSIWYDSKRSFAKREIGCPWSW